MSTLKLTRDQLAAGLSTSLGAGYVLFPDSNKLRDSITKPTLVLERTKVQPQPEAPLGLYSNSMSLVLIDNKTDDEDHLDDLLDDVLEALDDEAGVLWSDAVRGVYNGTNPCYTITLTASSQRKAL